MALMKVLMFVASPFTTDPRVYLEAKSLVEAGHKVTVIAWDREKQNPQRQSLDGIEIVRVRTWLSPKYGLGTPPWHAFQLVLWQWQAYRQTLELNKESAFDVIHCHFLDALFVGARLKQKLRLPLVYDARDIYGYMMQAIFPRWIANVFLRLEKWLITNVDRIIVVNEPMRKYFEGITDKPITVIMNCKPLQNLEYQPRGSGDKFTLLYIGTLHKSRPLSQILHVMKELPDVHCIIGGIGQAGYVDSIKEECRKMPNTTFAGRVPIDKVLPMTVQADAIFCILDTVYPYYNIAMPNKLFEAMVCGRPIICTKGIYSGEITEAEQIGLAVEYTEEAIEQAIIKLRDDPELRERLGRNALRAAITKYNWPNEEKKLLELYRDIESQLD
jgi:glycosyltransferase involved in cell wall biosynthesis